MIPTNPKIGEVFFDNNTYYEVTSLNEDLTFNSKVLIGYIPETTINEETIKEIKQVVAKKAPEKKAPAKKPAPKKK